MKKLMISLLVVLLAGAVVFPVLAQGEEAIPAEESVAAPAEAPEEGAPMEALPFEEETSPPEAMPPAAEAEPLISLAAKGMDISDALRFLFAPYISQGYSFSLSPEVKGKVTVSLNSVTFSAALRAILEQAGATYRKEGNIYTVIPLSQVSGGITAGGLPMVQAPRRMRVVELRFSDAAEIAYILGGAASGATGSFGAFGSTGPTGRMAGGRAGARGQTRVSGRTSAAGGGGGTRSTGTSGRAAGRGGGSPFAGG